MSVVFLRLALHGFGRFRNKVEVNFQPGINVCTAENEQGKTTLVEGLAAVIFGLPQNNDPRAFGTRRFRNWYNPTRFEGELEFLFENERYRIWRNFDNHRVSLQKNENGSWKEIARGEHKPQARRPNLAYEENIRRMFGMTSRELFKATFQVAHPLPDDDKIVPGIQQLLSGAGAHYRTAQDTLLESLKELTRYTGRMGITARDMNRDRLLEKLQGEYEMLKAGIDAEKENVDRLEVVARDLYEAEQAQKKAEQELAAKRSMQAAWQRWRVQRERYQDVLAKQVHLQSVLEKARLLSQRLAGLQDRISREFSAFSGADENTGEKLYSLAELEKERDAVTRELEEAAQKEEHLHGEEANLKQKLAGELADVLDKPWLPDALRRLREQKEALLNLQAKLQALDERQAQLKKRLSELPDFQKLGKAPLQALQPLRREINALEAAWCRFEKDLLQLEELEAERSNRYAVFENATPELRDALANYRVMRERLEKDLAVAREKRNLVLQRVEEMQSARRHFQEKFQDIEHLDDESVKLVDEKIALLMSKRELEKLMQDMGMSLAAGNRTGLLPALLLAVISAFAVFRYSGQWQFALAAGIAAGGVALLLGRRIKQKREMAKPQAKLGEINARLRQIDTKLGSFAKASEAALGELRARHSQRKVELARLEEMQKTLPGDDELQQLKDELDLAKKQLAEFESMTAEVAAAFEDVPAAYERWSHAVRECEALRKRILEFSRQYAEQAGQRKLLETDPAQMPEPWPQVSEFARVMGQDLADINQALRWFATLDENWWQEVTNMAAEYEHLLEEQRRIDTEKATILAGSERGQNLLEILAEEVEGLRKKVHPFDEETSPDTIEAMLQEAAEAEKELTRIRSLLSALAERREELAARVDLLNSESGPLQEELREILANFETAGRALLSWQQLVALREEAERVRREMEGIMGAQNCDSIEQMETRLADLAGRAGMLLQQWESVLQENPGLPSLTADDPESLDRKYRQLEESVHSLEEKCEQLKKEVREKEIQLARLQGRTPANIAVLEIRKNYLEKEINRLQEEAEALSLAFNTLSCAIEDFTATYRRQLADKAGEYFAQLTGRSGRTVQVDEQFGITVVDDGISCAVNQLSQGARDQLYISLRLSVADLLAGNITLPFIFDDPFLNWDSERLNNMKNKLEALSASRQVLILSHRKDFADWGTTFSL